jgi:hypothetical protein
MVENTTQRDPAVHVLGILSDGQTGYIEGMEAAGQRQVVNSDVLPAQAPWGALELLGFVKGDPVPGDDLFVRCTLPDGWSKAGTSHSMHSNVLDERGVERVGVFYKAAFYDRKADAHLINVGGHYATKALYGDGPAVLPDVWDVLVDTEREDFWASVDHMVKQIAEHPQIYGKYQPRVTALLAFREEEDVD